MGAKWTTVRIYARKKNSGKSADQRFSFRKHIEKILGRRQARLAITRRLTGCRWGPDAGIMRFAGEALIVSHPRYRGTLIGPGAYGRGLRKLDVRVMNVCAREIIGVSRTARISVPHGAVGIIST